jgi:hypothetical protein
VQNCADIPAALPNIAQLMAYGDIAVGIFRPVGCVAFQMLR